MAGYSFRPPGGSPRLEKDTTYVVALSSDLPIGNIHYTWAAVQASNQETGAAGWSIADHRLVAGASGGVETWTTDPDSLYFEVRGAAVEYGLVPSTTALTVAEGGTASYTVRLGAQPTGDVTVTVARAPGGSEDVTFDTSTASGAQSTLTFTTTNWNVPQTVEVTAATDTDMDGDTATLTHTASGGGYASRSADVAVTVGDTTDNTAPSLSGTTPPSVTGATLTLTYDEPLDADSVPPASAFSVRAGGFARTVSNVAVAGSAVTLTLAPVAAGAAVTLDYTVPTATGAMPIQDAAGNDAAGLSGQAVTNATPGVLLSRTALTLAEGDSADYTVRLATRPTGNVTVTVEQAGSGSEDVTFTPIPGAVIDDGTRVYAELTFTTSNWSTTQTVRVSAATDTDTDGDAATLSHTASGGGYDSVSADLAVTVGDTGDTTAPSLSSYRNEMPSVTGATLTLTYDEALDTASVPAPGDFAVRVGLDGRATTVSNVAVSRRAVTLTLATPVGADVPVRLDYTVPAGAGAMPIRDAAGNNATGLTREVVHNLTPGIGLSYGTLTVAENRRATYQVRLATQPVGTVTVSIRSDNEDVIVDTNWGGTTADTTRENTLTFTPSRHHVWQDVTVFAATDADSVDDTAILNHSAEGGDYDQYSAELRVTVTDPGARPPTLVKARIRDTSKLLYLDYNEPLDRGRVPALSAFTVRVAGSPVGLTGHRITCGDECVELTLGSTVDPGADVLVSYTAPSSNQLRDLDGDHAANLDRHAVEVLDTTRPGPAETNPLTVNGATITLNFDEALDASSVPGVSAFNVQAGGASLALIRDLAVPAVRVSGPTVTLTLAQAVRPDTRVGVSYRRGTPSPLQDRAGNEAEFRVPSATNITPGILLSPSTLAVAEGGSAEYTVRLNTQPSGTVTVTVARAAGGSTDVTFDTSANTGTQTTLTFTGGESGNWATPQTVTVSAETDTDMNHDRATLTHTAAGGGYDALTAGLPVTVTDAEDTTAPSLSTATAIGTTGLARLVLTYDEPLDEGSVPAADAFTVTVNGDARTIHTVVVGGSAVTLYLPRNWASVGDTVRVSYTAPATNPIRDKTGNDAGDLDQQAATVAGIVLSRDVLNLAEGTLISYTVRLATQPSGTVTVVMRRSGDRDVTFDTSDEEHTQYTLTFTTANWNTPQTVKVRANWDADVEDDSATLSHTPAGGGYAGLGRELAVRVDDPDDTTRPFCARLRSAAPS